jgi:hypothetical protein
MLETKGEMKLRWTTGLAAIMATLAPAYAQYGGPALLTRGQSPTAMQASQIDFRPFLALDANYDSGLDGVSLDANGKTTTANGAGITLSGGVSGLHSWKHTMLGLDFRANLRHYTSQSYYDGSDQTLMLGLTHQFTRHVVLSIRESAGTYSQNYATPALQQTVPFDPSTTYLPQNDFFNNRTVYLSSQADLQIQRSTRLSFNIGGDSFLTRYRSTALYGNTGVGARGDLQYRLSRRSTLGAGYSFTHFAFRGVLSSTDIHSLVGSYALALSRTVEFTSTFGFAFYETKFQREVPLDPVVAAIVCQPGQPCVGTQLFYGRNWSPNITARFSKTIPRGVIFAMGGHSITPGNGLFLTSTSTNIGGGYSYTGLKRWAVNTGVNYSFSNSVGNVVGNYSGTVISANISRQIMSSTHFLFGFNAHSYQSGDFQNYNRWAYGLHLGLGFTPGDIPVRFW